MDNLKALVLACAIVWLQILALSACTMDQEVAYQIVSGKQ